MKMIVRNTGGTLSAQQTEYASKKLGRLNRFFSPAEKVEVVHHEHKGQHQLAATVFAGEFVVRAAQTDSSVLAAIDQLAEKLDIGLRRLKLKMFKTRQRPRGNKNQNI